MAKTQLQRNKERKVAAKACEPYLYILKEYGAASYYAQKLGISSAAISVHLKYDRGIGAPILNKMAALLKKEHEQRESEKESTEMVACDELVVCAEV